MCGETGGGEMGECVVERFVAAGGGAYSLQCVARQGVGSRVSALLRGLLRREGVLTDCNAW